MIVAIFNVYLVLLFLLVKLKIVPFNLFWKISPAIVLVALLLGLFIPMGWGAPSGPVLVVRNSVPIVPDVAGEVVDVPVEANTPLNEGDILFKIDPTPYQAEVDALSAQLKFEELRLSQMTQLQGGPAGRAFDVESRQANVDQLKGQLKGAQWNLEKTTVRAPANGYVTNLALRKGARGGKPSAHAGHGLHRHVRYAARRGNSSEQQPLCRARPGRGGDIQVHPRPHLSRQGRSDPTSGLNRPSSS